MPSRWPVPAVALTPVAVGTVVWWMGGVQRVTVVVKATFGFVHGGTARLLRPLDLVPADRLENEILDEAAETAPYLPGAGVVLAGHAWAPGGRTATATAVRLCVHGERVLVDKTVHVFGDRPQGGGAREPFRKIPLGWARAARGEINPGGTRHPTIVDPGDPRRPAGLGPVPRTAALAAEIPEGIDFRAFHTAPPDQQIEVLRGDEWILLDGVHPTLARIRTRLPGGRAEARWLAGPSFAPHPVELAADTLAIDADRMVCSIVWRGGFVIEPPGGPELRVEAGLSLPGIPIPWPGEERAAAPAPAPQVRHPHIPEPTPTPTPPAAPAPRTYEFDDTKDATQAVTMPSAARATLPFRRRTLTEADAPRPVAPENVLPFRAPAGPAPPVPPTASVSETAPPPAPELALDDLESDHTAAIDLRDVEARLLAPFAVPAPGARPFAAAAPIPGAPWGTPAGPPPTFDDSPSAVTMDDLDEDHTGAIDLRDVQSRILAPFTVAAPGPTLPAPRAPIPGAPWSTPAAPPPFSEEGPGVTTAALAAPPAVAAPPLPADAPPAPVIAPPPRVPPPAVVVPPAVVAPPPMVPPPAVVPPAVVVGIEQGGGEAGRRRAMNLPVSPPPCESPPSNPATTPPSAVDAPPPIVDAPPIVDTAPVAAPRRVVVPPPVTAATPVAAAPVVVPAPRPAAPRPAPLPVGAAPASPGALLRQKVQAALAAKEPLRGLDLRNADLKGIDFSKAVLGSCKLAGADLTGCVLVEARLAAADLTDALLADADLDGADLTHADLSRATLTGATLAGAILVDANLTGARGEGASFARARALRATFARGVWDGARFQGLDGTGADFTGASIADARFDEAVLVEVCLDEVRGAGASFAGARLARARADTASLTGASFEGVDAPGSTWEQAALEEATFGGADLADASFVRATCPRARFVGAILRGARLERLAAEDADLRTAVLEGADLRGARFMGASFEGANLRGVQAQKVDFSRARLGGADLTGANLRHGRLTAAILTCTVLDSADLRDADLERADLTGASRRSAKMAGANLKDVVGDE